MEGSHFEIFHLNLLQQYMVKLFFQIVRQPSPPAPAEPFGHQYKMKRCTGYKAGFDRMTTSQQPYWFDASNHIHTHTHTHTHTHASIHTTSLMHVKNNMFTFVYDAYCLGHWNKENARTKTSNRTFDHFTLSFVNLSLTWILYFHVRLQNKRRILSLE